MTLTLGNCGIVHGRSALMLRTGVVVVRRTTRVSASSNSIASVVSETPASSGKWLGLSLPDRYQVDVNKPHCDDTHNRHQQPWTLLYSGGLREFSIPGSGRCWTSWLCFASCQGVRGSSPFSSTLAPPAKHQTVIMAKTPACH